MGYILLHYCENSTEVVFLLDRMVKINCKSLSCNGIYVVHFSKNSTEGGTLCCIFTPIIPQIPPTT